MLVQVLSCTGLHILTPAVSILLLVSFMLPHLTASLYPIYIRMYVCLCALLSLSSYKYIICICAYVYAEGYVPYTCIYINIYICYRLCHFTCRHCHFMHCLTHTHIHTHKHLHLLCIRDYGIF